MEVDDEVQGEVQGEGSSGDSTAATDAAAGTAAGAAVAAAGAGAAVGAAVGAAAAGAAACGVPSSGVPSSGSQYQYELFSMLMHSGSALAGHYFAYIKELHSGKWYKFNDSRVTDATEEELSAAMGGGASGGGAGTAAAAASMGNVSVVRNAASTYMCLFRRVGSEGSAVSNATGGGGGEGEVDGNSSLRVPVPAGLKEMLEAAGADSASALVPSPPSQPTATTSSSTFLSPTQATAWQGMGSKLASMNGEIIEMGGFSFRRGSVFEDVASQGETPSHSLYPPAGASDDYFMQLAAAHDESLVSAAEEAPGTAEHNSATAHNDTSPRAAGAAADDDVGSAGGEQPPSHETSDGVDPLVGGEVGLAVPRGSTESATGRGAEADPDSVILASPAPPPAPPSKPAPPARVEKALTIGRRPA